MKSNGKCSPSLASDAHVHVGYFLRAGFREPFYYSPRRIVGILKRCGISEFIFSSTDCFADVSLEDIFREAREVIRLFGAGAHPFFWVSQHAIEKDPDLGFLPPWYEGLKLHGGEFPWLERPEELRRVLAIAEERGFRVQIHTDSAEQNVLRYLPFCQERPRVHFDLAHCKSVSDVAQGAQSAENLWFDIAFAAKGTIEQLLQAGVPEKKILFGSDLPVQQRFCEGVRLTEYLRKQLAQVHSPAILFNNFKEFLAP
jgi:predicted TIM-barrel fold metal-dependent hydrolase